MMRPCAADHIDAAVCWRCSDLRPWWAEARERAGVALWVAPPLPEPARRCRDCGEPLRNAQRCQPCGLRAWWAARRSA